jgi:RNA polymerase sigma-32 factor
MSKGIKQTPSAFDGGLTPYLREIKRFPMLARDEEYLLARRWREHGDASAAQQLVTSHLRLVVKMARCCRGHTVPLGELISEGNVGLMQAINRFDPERGVRLSTYAAWWIHAAVQQYILSSNSLVKIVPTPARKKLFFGLRACKGQLQATDDGDLSPENVKKIAAWLDVSEADVIEMNHRLAGPDLSLNGSPGRPISEYGEEWLDILPDSSPDQETLVGERTELRQRLHLLNLALKHLDPRERDIISERRLREQPTTPRELGKRYAVSPERMRQIEERAPEKLRRSMHAARSPSAWSRRRERPSAGRPNVHAQVDLLLVVTRPAMG